ncbi:AMP-binding domain containing protein, partial [Asbolus verrucosus]
KIFQIDADLRKSETYSSVNQRSVRLAIALQNKGVTSTDVIASCSKSTLDNVIPIIASSYIGSKVTNLDPTSSKCGYDTHAILYCNTYYWITGIVILISEFLVGASKIFGRKTDDTNTKALTEIFALPIDTYALIRVKNPKMYDISSLKWIYSGTYPIRVDQFKRLDNLFENATIVLSYGATEFGTIFSFNPQTDQDLIKIKITSFGKVTPEISVKIFDPVTNKILGANQEGEICVKSPSMMNEYYNQDSFSCFDDDGFFKTGNIGYFDDDE